MSSKNKDEVTPRAVKAAQETLLPITTVVTEKGSVGSNGYWWPHKDEERACCRRVALRHARYIMVSHVRSKGHCARRYGITVATLNKAMQIAQVIHALES